MAMPRLSRTFDCTIARTAWFMQPMRAWCSSRLGWLYHSREAWPAACSLIERRTED